MTLLVLALAGCGGSSVGRYNLALGPGAGLANSYVEIDLIGENAMNMADWMGYSVDKYWTPGDPMRASAEKRTIQFQGIGAVQFSKEDPIWDTWSRQGADQLVVIANLPGSFEGGGMDPRRKFIPLGKKNWKDLENNTIYITVKERMIQVGAAQ